MARTYLFECVKCEYTAKVAGGIGDGVEFTVETILCSDCHELKDCVVSAMVPLDVVFTNDRPTPTVEQFMKELPLMGRVECRRQTFDLACPVSATHRIRTWNQPGKCPRCGAFLECTGFPFQQWD